MSQFTKRKRSAKDRRWSLFPAVNALKKQAPVEGSSVPSTATRSWERCGEGFLGTPVTQKRSRKSVKAVRQLVPSLSVPVKEEIVWSSSESDLSDCGSPNPSTVTGGHGGPRKEAVRNSYSRFLGLFSSVTYCEEDECHKIDWDSDFNEDDGEEMESLAEISENDSSSEDQKQSPKNPLALDGEISDFSDGAERLAPPRATPVSWQPDGGSRSASDWVRSMQAALRTPQKLHRLATPPEDSAKKRRKFLSGGLAERLSRLQCRQRSAISFWRHQSDSKTPAAGKVGVLVLKLLSVWEDCSMWAAMCQEASAPCSAPKVLVLFSRDTAAHLVLSPGDTVHVYPPWQKLLMEGERNPVVLNTHFSQKVLEDEGRTGDRVSAQRCGPYALTRVFRLRERSAVSEEEPAVEQIL